MGELFYGAEYSGKRAHNLKRVEELYAASAILDSDVETTRIYGRIKALLRKNGKPIPNNDVWIAAIALQYDLTVVTRDKHFNQVDNLKIERW